MVAFSYQVTRGSCGFVDAHACQGLTQARWGTAKISTGATPSRSRAAFAHGDRQQSLVIGPMLRIVCRFSRPFER